MSIRNFSKLQVFLGKKLSGNFLYRLGLRTRWVKITYGYLVTLHDDGYLVWQVGSSIVINYKKNVLVSDVAKG